MRARNILYFFILLIIYSLAKDPSSQILFFGKSFDKCITHTDIACVTKYSIVAIIFISFLMLITKNIFTALIKIKGTLSKIPSSEIYIMNVSTFAKLRCIAAAFIFITFFPFRFRIYNYGEEIQRFLFHKTIKECYIQPDEACLTKYCLSIIISIIILIYFFKDGIEYYKEKKSDAKQVSENSLNSAEDYIERGWDNFNENKDDEAITDFTKAIELEPENHEGYECRGYTYGKKGETEQAMKDLNKAIELSPNSCDAYAYRGVEYLFNEELDLAITDFTKSIELGDKQIFTYFHRGEAYFNKKEYIKAKEDFTIVLKLDKKHEEAKSKLKEIEKFLEVKKRNSFNP